LRLPFSSPVMWLEHHAVNSASLSRLGMAGFYTMRLREAILRYAGQAGNCACESGMRRQGGQQRRPSATSLAARSILFTCLPVLQSIPGRSLAISILKRGRRALSVGRKVRG
jgi:hypothetical protein